MFLNDLEIRRRVLQHNLIYPFTDYIEGPPQRPSKGLSCCGYDLSLGNNFKRLKNVGPIDPSSPPGEDDYYSYRVENNETFTLYPGQFVLAHTVETISMPDDLTAFVMDKSSLARLGLMMFNTCLEPAWCGVVTLELVNHSQRQIVLRPYMGICQVMFSTINKPIKDYLEKSGKYQGQQGVTIAR